MSNNKESSGKRLLHLHRLKASLKELESTVLSDPTARVTPELQAATLATVVDIDYHLRQLALSHGVTGSHRREFAEKKGQMLKTGKRDFIDCALCTVIGDMPCRCIRLLSEHQPVACATSTKGVKPCLSGEST